MNKEECIIKNLLEMWVSRNTSCFVSNYNFIKKESSNKYKISVNEKTIEDEVFLSIYEIWISDTEFRIIELD